MQQMSAVKSALSPKDAEPAHRPFSVAITLAGEPIAKGRPRATRTGILFTPQRTRHYEAMLRSQAAAEMGSRSPFEGCVSVRLEAHIAVPASWSGKKQRLALAGLLRPMTRPDVDNYLKCVDSCNGIVWRDDKQIVEACVAKFYSDRPRLVLTVSEI